MDWLSPGDVNAAKPTRGRPGPFSLAPSSWHWGSISMLGGSQSRAAAGILHPGTGRTSTPSTERTDPQGGGRLGLILILSPDLSSYKALLFRCPDPSRPEPAGPRAGGAGGPACAAARQLAAGLPGGAGGGFPLVDRLQAAGQGRLWKRDKMQLPGREERKSSI